MDLSSIKPVTLDVSIKHPRTGDPTGLVLTCISPNDVSAAGARRRLQDKQQRKGITEADTVEFLAALIQSWSWGDADWGGQKLPFSQANARIVLGEAWVRGQLDAALADDAAFFRD